MSTIKQLEVIVKPQDAALALGGQSPAQYGGHKGTARDTEGRPVLPATALRGALRLELERLLRGMNPQGTACNSNDKDGRPDAAAQEEPCPCPVCRLFGESGTFTGTLRLEDALLDPEAPDNALEAVLRPQVAVDRRTRAAADQHLLMLEATPVFPAAAAPTFRARGYLIPRGPEDDKEKLEGDLRNLQAACRALRAIGSGKARGLGWVECCVEEVATPKTPSEATHLTPGTLEVTFEALAPLHFGQGPPMGFFHPSQNHAGGSTVRGALAFALIERHPKVTESDGFQALFGPESATTFGSARGEYDQPLRVRRKCRPGEHVFDDLVPEVLRRHAIQHGLGLAVQPGRACPHEGCAADKTVPWSYTRAKPGFLRRVRSRVALNRRTATAMDAKLYSMEVVEPHLQWGQTKTPLYLRAEIRKVPAEALPLLASLQGQEIWLGGKRSKGLGRCRVTWKAAPPELPEEAQAPIEELDRALREGWRAIASVAEGNLKPLLGEDEWPLALLLTEPWEPEGEGAEAALTAGPLALDGSEKVVPVTAFVGLEELGRFGAVEARRYEPPKELLCGEEPPRQVVSPGSLYLYRVKREVLAAQLKGWLERGAEGAGRNREMGWGRFTIHGMKTRGDGES